MMKRSQFSLGRLFIFTAVLCAVLGFAVSFPIAAADFARSALVLAPTLAVVFFACRESSSEFRTIAIVAVGAILGRMMAPGFAATEAATFWTQFSADFGSAGVAMAVGAFVFSAIERAVFFRALEQSTSPTEDSER